MRSASYGHSLGGAVGLCILERSEDDGVIDKLYIDDGEWSIEIGKDVYPCTVSLRPLLIREMNGLRHRIFAEISIYWKLYLVNPSPQNGLGIQNKLVLDRGSIIIHLTKSMLA